ncbi:MAG TPA: hypothetical protein VLE49_18965 [Anaerolineales bacterium]|nr:hypothetical protein [Anaerolineales bacterium]
MVLLYVLFFVAGVVTFLITGRLGLPVRVGVALAIFIVPSILATLWLLKIGDKPPPDARTVYPQGTIQTPEKK